MSRGGGQGVNVTGRAELHSSDPRRSEGLEVTYATHDVLLTGPDGTSAEDGPAPSAAPLDLQLDDLPALTRRALTRQIATTADLTERDLRVLEGLRQVLKSDGWKVPPTVAEYLGWAIDVAELARLEAKE